MKIYYWTLLMSIALLVFGACNKDDDDDSKERKVGSFTIDGEVYDIISENDATTGVFQVFHEQAEDLSYGAFTISGASSANAGQVQIAVEYVSSLGVDGTYVNGDFAAGGHIYDPWLSSYTIVNMSGTSMINGNEPDGSLSIAKNSQGNYTLAFDFVFSDSTRVQGNITQDYSVQEMNIK